MEIYQSIGSTGADFLSSFLFFVLQHKPRGSRRF
ncbi:hypothetical protein POPTR_016G064901v4 [Populus trichocarpa]|uniref:glutamate carboxypeptidase II n=1 Tax=Populus trichocarpa TaxID=3694 RepID=A0A2K1XBM9_POPTR|nr:hypothetical protein POPTR_016G064901v4 [Populus trichocarpa]